MADKLIREAAEKALADRMKRRNRDRWLVLVAASLVFTILCYVLLLPFQNPPPPIPSIVIRYAFVLISTGAVISFGLKAIVDPAEASFGNTVGGIFLAHVIGWPLAIVLELTRVGGSLAP